jgi:hypothetical protein
MVVQAASERGFATNWDGNGGTGGNLTTAANWEGNTLPTGNDVATVNSNTSAASPATLASGTFEVDNVNLGSSTASFIEVNGGTLIALGFNAKDFSIGTGASQQSVFTLSSGVVEFGIAGTYTDGNDFDIGKNGNGKYVQTGGTLRHHADDFKIADSAGGVGVAEVSGGKLYVADGFSISDNAGGTGSLFLSGNAEVVSGNSDGLGGFLGSTGGGYISVANGGGTGVLNISGNAAMYGRYLEYRGEPGATADITVGGTGGKLIISEEKITGFEGSGSAANVIGEEAGATGQINVRESGTFAVDNPTFFDHSDGYVIARGGSGALSAEGTNARVVIRQRLLLASGGSDMDFLSGEPGSTTSGNATMSVGAGGNVAVSELHIGVTGTATLTQTGGSITAVNNSPLYAEAGMADGANGEDLYIGTQRGSQGTYNHSGGSIRTNDDFIIGHYGTGTYNMSGTAEVTGAGWTVLGNEEGSVGVWNVSGGTYTQSGGDLEIGDAGTGTLNFSGGTINVSGYTAVGHRSGSGVLNVSGSAVLNTPDLKILMGKDGNSTTSGVMQIGGGDGQINVANNFTMDESFIGNEAKLVAKLTAGSITTINVGGKASIARGDLLIESDPNVYSPKAGDHYVIIDTAGGWDGGSAFASVTVDVTLASSEDIMLLGVNLPGVGGSPNRYEMRVTARGDFNFDFLVDAADLSVLESNFGSAGATYASGDANEDGRVDGRDFLMWQRNFGDYSVAAAAAVAAVPEPATFSMALLGLATALRRRNRR